MTFTTNESIAAAVGVVLDSDDAEGDEAIEYQRPYLYPKQQAAIFDPHRYSCTEASTKSGKTSGCVIWLIERALAGESGHNFWWVAPVSSQAHIAFRRARRALPADMFIANLTDKTLTLFNGAVIWFKSGDKPDSLYGDDVHAAVVDEASRLKEDAWHAVRSTLTHTRGHVRIIGNVKGRRNWFYRLARRAEAGDPAMGYHKITAYDAIAAGVLASDEVADAKRLLPEHVFAALYLAEPSDDDTNPFGLEAIKRCVRPAMSSALPLWWGWDLAKKMDWTVGTGLDRTGQVCRFERFQTLWGVTLDRIKAVTRRTPALVDSTGVGDPILEFLQKTPGSRYEGYIFSQPSKQRLMEGLAVSIQSGRIAFPDGPIVVELEEFEFHYTKTGVRYAAAEGAHDDCVMSLALADYHRLNTRAPMVISDEVLARSARRPLPGAGGHHR